MNALLKKYLTLVILSFLGVELLCVFTSYFFPKFIFILHDINKVAKFGYIDIQGFFEMLFGVFFIVVMSKDMKKYVLYSFPILGIALGSFYWAVALFLTLVYISKLQNSSLINERSI